MSDGLTLQNVEDAGACKGRIAAMEGRKLFFKIQAWDAVELIGEANHERFIIDEARFLARVQAKGK